MWLIALIDIRNGICLAQVCLKTVCCHFVCVCCTACTDGDVAGDQVLNLSGGELQRVLMVMLLVLVTRC